MIQGKEQVLSGFDRLEQNLRRDAEQIPREFANSVKREIVATGSVDTGRMVSSIDYVEDVVTSGAGFHFEVGAILDDTVSYDGFVDQPGVTRNWAGRYFNERGIQNANLEPIFDNLMNESFIV